MVGPLQIWALTGMPEVAVGDDLATLILESVSSIRLGTEQRTRELRQRYLALALEGLRADGGERLPGPPPAPDELAARWSPR